MSTNVGSGDRALAVGNQDFVGSDARGIFGQVMGLVALTVGCTALGAYLGRISRAGSESRSSLARWSASSASTSQRRAA